MNSTQPRQFQSVRSMPDVQETDEVEDRVFYEMVGTTQQESQVAPNGERTQIDEWIRLQQSLKEEQYRMAQEYQLKCQLLDELKKESKVYYQTYIDVLVESNMNQEHKQLADENSNLFLNARMNVNKIFEQLSNTKVCSAILQHHNNTARTPEIETLIKTFVNSTYDNIACGSMWKQPILKLMSDIIITEVERQDFPEFLWDREETLSQFVMSEFAKRPENVKYTKVIFKNSLIQITKVDKFLDLDRKKIENKLREIKRQQREKEDRSLNSSTALLKPQPAMMSSGYSKSLPQRAMPIIQAVRQIELPQQNMTVYYANLIKQYDQSKKLSSKNRRTQNQLSEFSLKVLQFGEEQRQAKFISMERRSVTSDHSTSESPVRKLSEVYSHQGKSEQQLNNEINSVLIACIDKVKQLVNNIMDNIFKNIYLIPQGIRIICKMIQINLLQKFPKATEQQVQENIFSFLFNVWLIPQLVFPKQYSSFKFIREDHENTVQLIHGIMKKLIKNQKYNEDPQYTRLNQYIFDLQPSLKEYLQEILNLCPESVSNVMNNTNKQDGIESTCVCIAVKEVRTLCQLLQDMKSFKTPSQELQDTITQLVKHANRTMEIDNNEHFFNKQYDAQIYALILNFSIPNSKDLYEIPGLKQNKNEEQRNQQKLSKGIRQVLLDVQDLSVSPACSQEDTSLRRVFSNFVEKYTYFSEKTTEFRLRYVLELINNLPQETLSNNLKSVYQQLLNEYQSRQLETNERIQSVKYQLLSAKFNIRKNYEVMKESLDQLSQEKRQKQLYDFIEKTPLNFCVTSPKTREGLFSIKAMKLRNNQTLDENQIWVEEQKDCIHNAINLEFIKQIVGGASPNEQKKNSEFSNSHCSDIKQFIENFSALQEVKDAVITGEDKAGVRYAYFEFIKALADYLKQQDNMKMDEVQIMDMLEKYVSKRVYDKVYPKERTYKDAGLYFRIKSLDWLNYSHLDINKQNRVDEMWDLAAEALLNMDNSKTAVGKLETLIQQSKIMNDVLRLTSLKDEASSADTVLPIQIYILIKAAPQRLHSNLNFVQLFLDQNKTVGQQGYCLTQLQLAIQWLEELDAKMLKMDQLKFQETIAKAEIKYGIHYLKRRNRSERISMPLHKIQALNI